MEVRIERPQAQQIVISLIGRLDTAASQDVSKELEGLKTEASKTMILDCTELSYISSSGLRIFLTLRKTASAQGGRVIIRGLSNEIRSVFVMTGFLSLFEFE